MRTLTDDADALHRRLLTEAIPRARLFRASRTGRATSTPEPTESLFRLARLLTDLFGLPQPQRPRRLRQHRLPRNVSEALKPGPLRRHGVATRGDEPEED